MSACVPQGKRCVHERTHSQESHPAEAAVRTQVPPRRTYKRSNFPGNDGHSGANTRSRACPRPAAPATQATRASASSRAPWPRLRFHDCWHAPGKGGKQHRADQDHEPRPRTPHWAPDHILQWNQIDIKQIVDGAEAASDLKTITGLDFQPGRLIERADGYYRASVRPL